MTTNTKERIEKLYADLDKYEAMEERRAIKFMLEMAELAKKYESGEISKDRASDKVSYRAKMFVESIDRIYEMYREAENELDKLEA